MTFPFQTDFAWFWLALSSDPISVQATVQTRDSHGGVGGEGNGPILQL